jgi:hypothetical protein
LEDVQLRVEAFEYLQLPFVIKEGSVGRLKLQVHIHSYCSECTVFPAPWCAARWCLHTEQQ